MNLKRHVISSVLFFRRRPTELAGVPVQHHAALETAFNHERKLVGRQVRVRCRKRERNLVQFIDALTHARVIEGRSKIDLINHDCERSRRA